MKNISMIIMIIIAFSLVSCKSEYQEDNLVVDHDNIINVCTSHREEVYRPIISEFEQRSNNIVNVNYGGTVELLDGIRNNTIDCDLMFGGSTLILNSYTSLFESIEGNDITEFSKLPLVIIYNNKLVYKSNIPENYNDVLDERFMGDFAISSPLVSSTSMMTVELLSELNDMSPMELISLIYNQSGNEILESSGMVVDTVANGDKLVGITLEETARKALDSGQDIGIVYPEAGVYTIVDGIALIKNSANRASSVDFINFCVGEDVQKYIVDVEKRVSVRDDIENSASRRYIDFGEDSSDNLQAIVNGWEEYGK